MMESEDDGAAGAVNARVICAQICARVHHGFARAFHRDGLLEALVTDYWNHAMPEWSVGFSFKLKGRWHSEVSDVMVADQNFQTLMREIRFRLAGTRGWEKIVATNDAYQAAAVEVLGRMENARPPGRETVVFSYSFAARRLFQTAKRRGWKTELGQIAPGPPEIRLVGQLETRCRTTLQGAASRRKDTTTPGAKSWLSQTGSW